MPLAISPATAKAILFECEGRLDHKGENPGHTIRDHVNITATGLANRMLDGPSKNGSDVFWRSAFLTVDSAAQNLFNALQALSADSFVVQFWSFEDGRQVSTTVQVPPFLCRDQRGQFPASHVHIYALRMKARLHGLHVVTLYPAVKI